MGKSTAELMQMGQKGELMSDKVLPLLIKGMGQYAGAMDLQSKTFNGMMSTLKDGLKIASGKLTVPLFDYLKTVLPDVIKQVDAFTAYVEKNPKRIQEIFNQIGSVIATVGKFAGNALQNLYTGIIKPLFDFISANKTLISSVFQSFLDISQKIGSTVGTIFSQLLTQVLIPFFNLLLQNKATITTFFNLLLNAATSVVPILASILNQLLTKFIVPLLNYLAQNQKIISDFFGAFGGLVIQAVQLLAQLLGQMLQTVIIPFMNFLSANKDLIVQVISTGLQLAAKAVQMLMPVLASLFESVVVPFLNFLNQNKDQVASFFAQFGGVVIQAIIALSGIMGDLMTSVIIPLMQVLLDNKDTIINILVKGIQLVQWAIETALPFLVKIIGAVTDFVGSISSGDGKGKIFSDIGQAISDFVTFSSGLLTDIIAIVNSLWDLFGDDVQSYLANAWSYISTVISSTLKVIQGVIKLVLGLISGDTKSSTEGLKLIFSGLGNFLVGLFKGWVTLFPQVLWAALKGIATVVTNLGLTILNGLESLGKTLWGKLSEAGKNAVLGLISGLMGAPAMVAKAAISLADNLVNTFKSKLGIHSPSRIFKGLGQFVTDGLGIGIDNGSRSAIESVKSLASGMVDAFNPQLSTGFDLNSSLDNLSTSATAVQKSSMDKQQVITLEGDLAQLVTQVKSNVKGDLRVATSGGLKF